MKSANLASSQRLQRVDNLLADGREYSTMEIIAITGRCAVNSIISELRDNGRNIRCRREGNAWFYRRLDV